MRLIVYREQKETLRHFRWVSGMLQPKIDTYFSICAFTHLGIETFELNFVYDLISFEGFQVILRNRAAYKKCFRPMFHGILYILIILLDFLKISHFTSFKLKFFFLLGILKLFLLSN